MADGPVLRSQPLGGVDRPPRLELELKGVSMPPSLLVVSNSINIPPYALHLLSTVPMDISLPLLRSSYMQIFNFISEILLDKKSTTKYK